MKETNILIVDDSPFQLALLNDALTESGFNVVGEAMSLEEVVSEVKRVKPNVVTMDITIPGSDGFECAEAVLKIDPSIKIIMVSSMMDEELIKRAKKLNVSGYIQKPFDKEELELVINRVMNDMDLYTELEKSYSSVFRESMLNMLTKLTKGTPKVISESFEKQERNASGISIVMGITGKCCGRVIFDVEIEDAFTIGEKLLRRPAKDKQEASNVMAELANMFSGNACSVLNKRNIVLGLRVAPPTTLCGESIKISSGEIESSYTAVIDTGFGKLTINIGFKRGESEWMSII